MLIATFGRLTCLGLAAFLGLAVIVALAAAGCAQSGVQGATPGAAQTKTQVSPTPTPWVARHGWAVGFDGAIVTTADGGRTWWRCRVPSKEDLFAVAASDRRHVWAVGYDGVILASSDGGTTWRLQRRRPNGEYLSAVSFRDRRHGWAVGPPGLALRTNDGGRHWRHVPIAASTPSWRCEFDDLALVDPEHGFASGSIQWGREVLYTMAPTGGARPRWHELESAGTPRSFGGGAHCKIAFVDAQHGWVADQHGKVWATSDGGASWVRQRSQTSWLFDIVFLDVSHGWMVGAMSSPTVVDDEGHVSAGGWPNAPVVLTTDDGGATWRRHQLTNAGRGASDLGIFFSDLEHGWITVDNRVLATSDGGQSWRVQYRGQVGGLLAITFNDAAPEP